jgi:hypothetical protein
MLFFTPFFQKRMSTVLRTRREELVAAIEAHQLVLGKVIRSRQWDDDLAKPNDRKYHVMLSCASEHSKARLLASSASATRTTEEAVLADLLAKLNAHAGQHPACLEAADLRRAAFVCESSADAAQEPVRRAPPPHTRARHARARPLPAGSAPELGRRARDALRAWAVPPRRSRLGRQHHPTRSPTWLESPRFGRNSRP